MLDCISGYLRYVEFLHGNDVADPPALNLGPLEGSDVSVAKVADIVGPRLGITAPWKQGDASGLPEKTTLKLDRGLAEGLLGWSPNLDT